MCALICYLERPTWYQNTYGMLCGEIIRSPNRSPYVTLLSSLYPMMTAAVTEDDNLLGNYFIMIYFKYIYYNIILCI